MRKLVAEDTTPGRTRIWEEFQERFQIPKIREFYGATEGTAPLVNFPGIPGLVGRMLPGQTGRKSAHLRGIQSTLLNEPVCGAGRIETTHLHGPLDRRPVSTDHQVPVSLADGHDIQVELRGEVPVQRQLRLAHLPPHGRLREIRKVEPHGLFHLVGELSC